MVVDDTVDNLRLLASMLESERYDVRTVINGRQALQAAERHPPDLILLDISMPDMDGYEVCTRLKARRELEDIPVIFLTALNDVADKVKAFGVGGVDYITKPFQIEEVRARVRTHLALRHASLELSMNYDRLRALEKLRDDLVHMVVHDMRSPLMILNGHLRLIEEQSGRELSADSRDDLLAAGLAAQALTRMTNDLLDVSRLEAGKLPIVRASADLGLLAERVAQAFRSVESSRAISLEVRGDVVLQCDSELVRRVLENLVSNGIKHTKAGASIDIVVQALDHSVRVAVQDQGSGVPPDARKRIFEKFETVAARREQKYHSAGLGLAFCKLAVEAHGGKIGVDAREPRGSTFWFNLPA